MNKQDTTDMTLAKRLLRWFWVVLSFVGIVMTTGIMVYLLGFSNNNDKCLAFGLILAFTTNLAVPFWKVCLWED